jgi:purine-nucleoside phosphorylase
MCWIVCRRDETPVTGDASTADGATGKGEFTQIAEVIRERTGQTPAVGMILGSGLGDAAEAVQQKVVIPYAELPHWPVSTVVGHAGRLHVGRWGGHEVLAMQGRVHYLEGYSMRQVTLPVRVMQAVGIETPIVTNAAGGIDPAFSPGDIMLIEDHINLVTMFGRDPLIGPNDEILGPRYPDMSNAYDPELRALALDAAGEAGIVLRRGVYVCQLGPSFETDADVRLLERLGADAVGMSTVPEVIVARHGDLRVLGLSCITNVMTVEHDHEEVLAAAAGIAPRLGAVIEGVLRRL